MHPHRKGDGHPFLVAEDAARFASRQKRNIAGAALKFDEGRFPRADLRDHNCGVVPDLAKNPYVIVGLPSTFNTPEYRNKLVFGRPMFFGITFPPLVKRTDPFPAS
jgi:hypothetical protein